METPDRPSPTSIDIPLENSSTTPVAPSFSPITPPLMTKIGILRSNVNSTRDIVFSQLRRLSTLQEQLASNIAFEKEEENLRAISRWADQVQDVAFELAAKAGSSMDGTDYLVLKLEEEEEEKENRLMGEGAEEAEKMGLDDPREENVIDPDEEKLKTDVDDMQ